jgi:hypothetical protein
VVSQNSSLQREAPSVGRDVEDLHATLVAGQRQTVLLDKPLILAMADFPTPLTLMVATESKKARDRCNR